MSASIKRTRAWQMATELDPQQGRAHSPRMPAPFDTLAASEALQAVGVESGQAHAIANQLRLAAGAGQGVTRPELEAALAKLETKLLDRIAESERGLIERIAESERAHRTHRRERTRAHRTHRRERTRAHRTHRRNRPRASRTQCGDQCQDRIAQDRVA